MGMGLQKTSDIDAVIISDSEDDEPEREEPSEKKRRVDHSCRMQYQRYHYLGPEAWQLIIQNMLDQHPEAPEQHKRDVAPWSATTPTFVIAMMARRDALDLTKAWPKIVKQHPHIKLTLIMLVSTGELEPTESACKRRLADMYVQGAFSVPGLQQLPPLPSDWEQRILEQVQEENTQKIARFGSLETVEMSNGRPVITHVLRKWLQHREFGPKVQALVTRHELEWGCQPEAPEPTSQEPGTQCQVDAPTDIAADSFVKASSIDNILVSMPALTKKDCLSLDFCMGQTVYLSNKSANNVIELKAGTALCSWGRLKQRPATEAEAKRIAANENIPGLLTCSWSGKEALCLHKHALSNVLQLAQSLRSSGTGSMIHLNVRGYEALTSDTEVLLPTSAPTVWIYTEERLPDPTKAADPKPATLKASSSASLLPQQVPRNSVIRIIYNLVN